MVKKGDVWISAVLYIAISIVVIVLILGAVLPLIQKAREESVITQTKQAMLDLDKTIRNVINEGAGSQRVFSMEIGKGSLYFDVKNDTIEWNFETSAIVSEPGVKVHIGNLELLESETNIKDKFFVTLTLNYNTVADLINKDLDISGRQDIIILNNASIPDKIPVVLIKSK